MTGQLDTDPAVLAFLRDWADRPEIETHAARIFLRGGTALKIKRPVRYDFLDFRRLDDRKAVLDRELELNAPNAPMLYQAVVPITRSAAGTAALNGQGEVLEWALQMAAFPPENELSAIARQGALDWQLAEALGEMIHDLHAKAPPRAENGAELTFEILNEFRREFQSLGHKGVALDIWPVLDALEAGHARLSSLLQERSDAGCLRRCHGDLHMRNIVVLDGRPVAFDALEFSERLGTCDVLYDLAFLLMDLDVAGQGRAANDVLNAYIAAEDDMAALQGLGALPFFKSMRAVIRVMVAAEQFALSRDKAKLTEAKTYIAYARHAIRPLRGAVYAIGGLSGTGKTTLARGLRAELGPGAIHIRSDVERKRLAGVTARTRLSAAFYDRQSSLATYAAMHARARICLEYGLPVLLDAVFSEEKERDEVTALARQFDVECHAVWLEAPQETRSDRVSHRHNDASDADAGVVRAQSAKDCGSINWPRVRTDGGYARTLDAVRRALTGAD